MVSEDEPEWEREIGKEKVRCFHRWASESTKFCGGGGCSSGEEILRRWAALSNGEKRGRVRRVWVF
jgi:hypothetical protein